MTALATGIAGTVRRHTMAACAVVVLAAAWWWQLAAMQEARELVWLAVTAFSVLTGFVALGWLRPARVGITAPQAMMLLGTLGMLVGLAFDVQRAGLMRSRHVAACAPDFLAIAAAPGMASAMHGIVAASSALVLAAQVRPATAAVVRASCEHCVLGWMIVHGAAWCCTTGSPPGSGPPACPRCSAA
jgi:hypothetical protein